MILRHEIFFYQPHEGKERMASLALQEEMSWISPEDEGAWRHGRLLNPHDGETNLYKNFPKDELKRLWWRYNTQTFVIEVGAMVPTEDHKRGKYQYFRTWISLLGAKRLADYKFSIAAPTSIGAGVARYELHGSSDTFKQGSGQWHLATYPSNWAQ
jgi:hypothetical protein